MPLVFQLTVSLVLICGLLKIASGESFFLSGEQENVGFAYEFKVIKGGDGKAGFGIRDPFGTVVMPYAWKDSAEYEIELVPQHGVYQFCIDNSLSRFNAKLISLYCSSYVRDQWDKLVNDLKDSDGTVSNMTSSLQNVDKNIGVMLRYTDQSRRHKQHDFLLLESNFNYINNLSITFCCIFIFSSIGQVFFLKKLFNEGGSSSSVYKPSA